MITLSLIVCLVGGLLYLFYVPQPQTPRDARVAEITRLMFGAGLLAYLIQVVKVFGSNISIH